MILITLKRKSQIDLGENLNKPKSNALNGRKFVLGNQKFLEKILNNELSSYAEQFEAWERSKTLQKRLCELMLVSSAFKVNHYKSIIYEIVT